MVSFVIKLAGTNLDGSVAYVTLSMKENLLSGFKIIPTPRIVIGISEQEGVSKAKIFKGKPEAKLEIPGGWGGMGRRAEPKNHPKGGGNHKFGLCTVHHMIRCFVDT